VNKGHVTKARILDTAVIEQDKDITKQLFHYMITVNDRFDVEKLKIAIDKVASEIPIIKSTFEHCFWRDRWNMVFNYSIDVLVKEEVVEGDDFKSLANEAFKSSRKRVLSPEKEPPFRCMIWKDSQGRGSYIVFLIHHSIVDPVGGLEIIKLIASEYEALIEGKEISIGKNHRGLGYLVRKIGVKDMFASVKQMTNKPQTEPIYQELCPLAYNNTEVDGCRVFEKYYISSDEIKELRKKYKKYGFTVNDLLLIIVARLEKKYNENLIESSTHVYLSVGVGLRKYLSKDLVTVTNYAGRDEIILPIDKVSDLDYIAEEFKKFKLRPVGIVFLIPFLALAGLPIKKQQEVWRSAMQDKLINWSNRAFSTTNIGNIDSYVKGFGNEVVDFNFFASFGYGGLPIISASGYKKNMNIYFSKHIDTDGQVIRVKDDFIKEWKVFFNEKMN